MRFLRLDLIAFGAFTNAALQFTAEGPGLNVIYGPNEAGKSTALRAVRAALFGIPDRTGDNFLHKNEGLRVGATVESAEAGSLAFIRRKGRKDVLLAADGRTPLPADALRPFLGGVTEDTFFPLFALGQAELRAGGAEVLRGEGEIGGLLFMTAAGLPKLRSVERELIAEADALFKPAGKLPPINEGLARFKALRDEQKSKSLKTEEHVANETALREAVAKRERLTSELGDLKAKQSKLTRIGQALPTAARLRQRRAELSAVADAPRLPADFTANRLAVERDSRILSGEVEQLAAALRRVEAEIAALIVPEALLAAAAEIDSLKERLGSHKTATAHIPQRESEIATHARDAQSLLRSVRPDADLDAVASLRLTRQEQATVRELAARGAATAEKTRQARDAVRKLRERIDRVTAELDRLGPEVSAEPLRAAIRAAARDGDLDTRLSAAESAAADRERHLNAARASLPLLSGDVADVRQLPVPDEATLNRFEEAFAVFDRESERLAQQRDTVQKALRDAERELAAIVRERDVPDEEDLRSARQRRDVGWREVRRELDGRGPGPDRESFLAGSGRPLADAYEDAVRDADDIADSLHHDAERVERAGRLKTAVAASGDDLRRIAAETAEMEKRREQVADDWEQHWPFLTGRPLMPREMRGWCDRYGRAARLTDELTSARAEAADLRERFERHTAALHRTLSGGGDPCGHRTLAALLDDAERELSAADEFNARRRRLTEDLANAKRELAAAEADAAAVEQELTELRVEWAHWMQRLGLPEATRGEAAQAVLDALAEIDRKLDAIAALEERIEGMRADSQVFRGDVVAAAARLAPELAERPVEEIAATLHERLAEARTLRARRDQLIRQRDAASEELMTKRRRAAALAAELAVLCGQAGCADPAELPAVEARAARCRTLEREVAEAEDELRWRSGGRSVDEFLAELSEIDADAVEPELARLKSEIATREIDSGETNAAIGRHEQALSQMTGRADAAEAAQDAEEVLARLATNVERFARFRLAAALLRRGREEYRKRNDNPVLERAAKLFSQLTCGRYSGLELWIDENDEPTLRGVLDDGRTTVRPDVMSDGTADQLYLALRLAGLHAWLDRHEPLPFVVDDLLIHFDDERAAAALRVLAELAERTQVLFFTHHRHLVELADERLPTGSFQVHDLAGAGDRTPADEVSLAATDIREMGARATSGRSKRSLF